LNPRNPVDEKSKGTSTRDSPSRVTETVPELMGESKVRVMRAIPATGVVSGAGSTASGSGLEAREVDDRERRVRAVRILSSASSR